MRDRAAASTALARAGTSGEVIRLLREPQAMVSPPQTGRGHVVVPRTGLRLPRRMTFDAWLDIGMHLSAVVASSAWCLGDWLAYGQDTYEGRYRDAVERTGLNYQTLRNYAWVARRFELSRRRDTLSFGHHAEVAALSDPEQDFWLRKAGECGWSTSQLRRQVAASLRERSSDADSAAEPVNPGDRVQTEQEHPAGAWVAVRLRLTPTQAQVYDQVASQQGLTVPDWAAQILDQAARGSLPAPAASRQRPDTA